MIEDTLQPETAIEIALLNRIRELRTMLYERGVSSIPREIDLAVRDAPLTLQLAASVTSEMKNERLRITARTYGPSDATFGIHSYVTREVLNSTRPDTAVRYLGQLHRDVTQKLAQVLSKGDTQ